MFPIAVTRGHGTSARMAFISSGIWRLASEMISTARSSPSRSKSSFWKSAKDFRLSHHALCLSCPGCPAQNGGNPEPSKDLQRRLLDPLLQHRMQAVARCDVDGKLQIFLQKELDAGQVEKTEPAGCIIVDKEIQ